MNEAEVWKLQGSLSRIADPVQRGDVYYQIALANGDSPYNARVAEYEALGTMWSGETNDGLRSRIDRRMRELESEIIKLEERK